ncbi:hypothetical protein VHEMI10166 [[Torrubiella] hemipterigena]|uniref:Uncharacterized protein n=1 Tax=[Torrubiella] hemipterigena TaxID=1531966 RepID=A0A0A1TSV7_9HYPO|nr:hypothetical protein VHEMI10166 [[Torrubiella] hemipterigena]
MEDGPLITVAEAEQPEEVDVLPVAPDEVLDDIRSTSRACQELLERLRDADSSEDRSGSYPDASRELTSFSIWASGVGAFRHGQQSLASRLKTSPETSNMMKQLLLSLKDDLENQLQYGDDAEFDASDTDESSDGSSIAVKESDSEAADGIRNNSITSHGLWMSIHNTITSLRQIGISLHRGGTRHRQERIDRYVNLDRNKQQYEMFKHLALQKVEFLFPNASSVLQERMAKSIATRRARFSYLEQHQVKLQAMETAEKPQEPQVSIPKAIKAAVAVMEEQETRLSPPSLRSRAMPSLHQRTELSHTVATKIEMPKKAESVASVQIPIHSLPPIPIIDRITSSFKCPYCSLTCPSTEASSEEAWRRHLIGDFEPFFCTFDDCSDVFECSASYSSWLSHIQKAHMQSEWHCWYCRDTTSGSHAQFSSEQLFKDHLTNLHSDRVTETVMSTVIKHSEGRNSLACQTCAFCGGYPEEIEALHPTRESPEALLVLENHIKSHFMSLSLILLPVVIQGEAQQDGGGESDADRGNESQQDSENLEGLTDLTDLSDWNNKPRFISEVSLHCANKECDCRVKSSIPSGIFSSFPATMPADVTSDERRYNAIDPAFYFLADGKEWEFWYPLPLPPGSEPTAPQYPNIEDDKKLRDYFQLQTREPTRIQKRVGFLGGPREQILGHLYKNFHKHNPPFTWYKKRIPKAALNTCNWIYQNRPVQDWVAGNTKLIVVTGTTGTGKSVLVKHMLEPSFADSCYFIFSGIGANWSNHALAAILIQILEDQPDFYSSSIEEEVKSEHWKYRSSDFLCEMLERIASKGRLSRVLVFLDGIELCMNLPEMQEYIRRLITVKGSCFRFFVTSQSEGALVSLLTDVRFHKSLIDLDNTPDVVSDAEMVTNRHLTFMTKNGGWSSEVASCLRSHIRTHQRNFLDDAFVIQYLDWKRPSASASEAVPADYGSVVNRLMHEKWSSEKDRRLIFMAAMSEWPLTMDEVANIMAMGDIENDPNNGNISNVFRKHANLENIETYLERFEPLIFICDGRLSFDQRLFLGTMIKPSPPSPNLTNDVAFLHMEDISKVVATSCALYLNIFNRMTRSTLEDVGAVSLLPYAARNFIYFLQGSHTMDLREISMKLFDTSSRSFQVWYSSYQSTQGANYSVPILPCNSAIVSAFFGIDWLTARYLDDGEDINGTDASGRTALSWAASSGRLKIVTTLVKRGADISAKDKLGRTALTCAAASYQMVAAKLLLDSGAMVEVQMNPDHTVVTAAVREGITSMIQSFMTAGIDFSSRATLLKLSLEHKKDDIAKLFLETGATIDIIDLDNDMLHSLTHDAYTGSIKNGVLLNYTQQFGKRRSRFPRNSLIRLHPTDIQKATFRLYDNAAALDNEFAPYVQALKDLELGVGRRPGLRKAAFGIWKDVRRFQNERTLFALGFVAAKTLCIDSSPQSISRRIGWLETATQITDVTSQIDFDFLQASEQLLIEQYEANGQRADAIRVLLNICNRQHPWLPTPGISRLGILVDLARLYAEDDNMAESIAMLQIVLEALPSDPKTLYKMEYLKSKHRDPTSSGIVDETGLPGPYTSEDGFVEPEFESDRYAVLHILLVAYCDDKAYESAWKVVDRLNAIMRDRDRGYKHWLKKP